MNKRVIIPQQNFLLEQYSIKKENIMKNLNKNVGYCFTAIQFYFQIK